MTTESAEQKKPEEQAKPVEQQAAGADPAQTEEEKIWAEAIADEKPETAEIGGTGEVISHEMADTSEPVTESKVDAGKDASEGADKPVKDAAKGTPSETQASTSTSDVWANAPADLKAAHEAEIAALRSKADSERIYAGRMKKKFEELKASASRGADTLDSSKIGDTLKTSLADYPEIAKPLEDTLAPIAKQIDTLKAAEALRNADTNSEVSQHIRSQREVLDAAHPGWMEEYVTGARAKQFYDWVLDQPRAIREVVFETNKDEIFDARAGIKVFDAFKASLAPPETSAPVKDDGQTQELSAKRAAQLDGTVSPRSPGGAPRRSGIPENGDPKAIWDAIPDDNADDRLKGGSFSRRRA